MSAARHATDANSEALRLHLNVQDLCARALLGENVSPEELSSLLKSSACVQFHTARTLYAVNLFESNERRAVAA